MATAPASRPLAYARYYARHVGPVFPLIPGDKKPLGSLAPHGLNDATIDIDKITRWWTTTPDAGIGLRTGRESGIVVIDVDPRHGGDASLAKMEAEHGPLPETVEAVTGGGGRHLVFAYPAGDLEIRNCVELAGLPGIDVRGDGGYICVAPTVHPSGQAYRWRADRSPKTLKPAPLPDWLLGMLTAPQIRQSDNGHRRGGFQEGERNHALTRKAGAMRHAGLDREDIEAALVVLNDRFCNPPLPEAEVRGIAKSISRYETGVDTGQETVLTPVPAAELLEAARAPVDWCVRPLHTCKGVRIVGAPGKTMKTTWTIAELVKAIDGGTLAGQFEVQAGHTVAWFDAENSRRSWSRKFLAVCQGLEVNAQDILDSGRFCYFNSRGLYLDDPATLQAVIDASRNVGATQIVLDSLTRIHRQKEADAVAMSSFFVDRIFKLRDEVIAGITILHHTRKGLQGYRDNADDALRGTGDLRNVVDSYISLSRSRRDKDLFTITVSAQRDAAEEGPFHWRLDWTDEHGARFLKADAGDPDGGEPRPPGRPPTAYQSALGIVRDAIATDPALSWTKAIAVCDQHGIGRTTATRAYREIKGA